LFGISGAFSLFAAIANKLTGVPVPSVKTCVTPAHSQTRNQLTKKLDNFFELIYFIVWITVDLIGSCYSQQVKIAFL
jgi:hypothetical protein